MKKPSGKVDLAIHSYSVVVSGWCTSVTIKLVNKKDSNFCVYMVDFLRSGTLVLHIHNNKVLRKKLRLKFCHKRGRYKYEVNMR